MYIMGYGTLLTKVFASIANLCQNLINGGVVEETIQVRTLVPLTSQNPTPPPWVLLLTPL